MTPKKNLCSNSAPNWQLWHFAARPWQLLGQAARREQWSICHCPEYCWISLGKQKKGQFANHPEKPRNPIEMGSHIWLIHDATDYQVKTTPAQCETSKLVKSKQWNYVKRLCIGLSKFPESTSTVSKETPANSKTSQETYIYLQILLKQ